MLPFPEEVPKKQKKTKDFRVLAKARLKSPKSLILESWRRRGLKSPKSLFFLVFLVPLQENASFWWKTLPFPEEVPKKPKKTKILESWRRRG